MDEYPALTGVTTAESYRDIIGALRRQGLAVLAAARKLVEASGLHCETLLREVTGERVSDIIRDQAAQYRCGGRAGRGLRQAGCAAQCGGLVAEEATSAGCDMVVVGTHGRRGVGRWMLGSQAEEIARWIWTGGKWRTPSS